MVLGAIIVSAPAHGQDEERRAARAHLLGQWLETQALQQKAERRFTGGSLLGVGAAGAAFGAVRLAQDAPANELSKGGSVALIAAGAFGIGLGIFRLAVRSEAEEVSERWARASASEIDDVTLARFEGEFYAAAQHARRIQQLTRWLGLSTALAGLAIVVATPFTSLSHGGRVAAFVGGGLLMLGGGINIASSLATPPPIKAWDSYKPGQAPGPTSQRLFGVVPWFHPRGAGVSLVAATGRLRRPIEGL
jgi:hypothetical protein